MRVFLDRLKLGNCLLLAVLFALLAYMAIGRDWVENTAIILVTMQIVIMVMEGIRK